MSKKSTLDNFNPDSNEAYDYEYQPDEESLKQKERALAEREAELERRAKELEEGGSIQEGEVSNEPPQKKPNWPICKPFLYHNLLDEPKPGLARVVGFMGYIGWFVMMAVLLLNHIGAWVTVFSPVTQSDNGIAKTIEKVQFLVISFLYIPILIPLHFGLCYWPLYSVLRSLNIFRFIIFFITYGFHILFVAFCLSGYYPYGPCGILLVILYLPPNGGWVGTIANLILSCVWILCLIYFVVIFILMLVVFKREYGSMRNAVDKAKEQGLSGIKDGVKEAVEFGVKTAVTTALTKEDK